MEHYRPASLPTREGCNPASVPAGGAQCLLPLSTDLLQRSAHLTHSNVLQYSESVEQQRGWVNTRHAAQ